MTCEAAAARARPAGHGPRRSDRAGSPDGAKRRPDAGARESQSPWPGDRARAGPGTGRTTEDEVEEGPQHK